MTSSAFASGCTTYIRNGMIWKYFMRVTTMLFIREIQTDFGGVKGIPKLERDSPCKRICLFLRWVVRKSPVDLGIWNIIHPTELYIPLDAHVAKMAHQLGITTRKTEDWKMVQQVTNYMKTIFPDDPCRGDFALFGYSINNK